MLLLLLGLTAPSRETGLWSHLRFGSRLGYCHRWWHTGLSGPAADSVRLVNSCCRLCSGWILRKKRRFQPRAFSSSRRPRGIPHRLRGTGCQVRGLQLPQRFQGLGTQRGLGGLVIFFLRLPLVFGFETLLISVGRFIEARPFGSALSLQFGVVSTHRSRSVLWAKIARRVCLGRLLSPRCSFTPRASQPI